MELNLEKYTIAELSVEELSVMAAFMRIPFLYGVSGDWMNSGYGDLRSKIRRIVKEMEKNEKLLLEPGGVLYLDDKTFHFLETLKDCKRIARIVVGDEKSKNGTYFYQSNGHLLFININERRMCRCGEIAEKNEFVNILAKLPKEDLKKEWMTILLMQEQNGLYESVYDIAWREGEEPSIETYWKVLSEKLYGEGTRE